MSQLSANLQTFVQKLDGLRDWPDKHVITELSAITEKNISFAEHFAKIIVAKLTDSRTHSTYKLPFFYVIDSIMKHVGGPFAVLFGNLFSENYVTAVSDLCEKDRGRLSFLLDTWNERRFMSQELLMKMKTAMNNSNSRMVAPVVAKVQPVSAPVAQQQQYSQPRSSSTAPSSSASRPAATTTSAYHGNATATPIAVPATRPTDALTAGMFADLVQNEMVAMLNQMYADLGIANPMSLDQLAAVNPSLYAQIRDKAEETAHVIIAKRKLAASGDPSVPLHPANSAHQLNYPVPSAASTAGRKRTAEHPPSQQHQGYRDGPGGYPPAATQYTGANVHQQPQQHQPQAAAPQSQYGSSSRFSNANPSRELQQTHPGNQYTPGGALPALVQEARSSIPAPAPIPQVSEAELQQQREEERRIQEELRAKYASDFFVNGFLGEAPIVVDVARVQALRDLLHSQYSSQSNRNDSIAGGGTAGTTTVKVENSENINKTKLSEGFLSASRTLTNRLTTYLNDIQTPPKLPSMLFGPLPLVPIFGPSAEVLDERARLRAQQNGVAPAAVVPSSSTVFLQQKQPQKIVTKLPIPPFKVEELGRNPEKIVAALYVDKPFQFHEDGLRFSTLSELKLHTDKHLELKKLLLKRATVREYRDWYCTSTQWVTDFSALSLGGAAGVGATVTSASSSSTGAVQSGRGGEDEEEEYILPADEHFTRCPVSREVFECVWDEEEGEMMHRNAVKVLVTEAADPGLYRLAQPVPWEKIEEGKASAPVRYLVVHKLLVLDQWLAAGRAVPLRDAVIRYKTASSAAGNAKAEKLMGALGQDDDEDDVFVLLEFGSN